MSRNVFLSYSRQDAEMAAWVRATLTKFGHQCWMDERLEGGDEWWQSILQAIQWCDVYIPLLSPNFVTSEACQLELTYAIELQRPLVPTHVAGELGKRGFVPAVSERQWIDLRQADGDAEGAIVRSVTKLPAAPGLPNPLPSPPQVPISYTLEIRGVLARPTLDRESQEWVLGQVDIRSQRAEEPQDLIELLDELQRHDSFLNALASRRDHLRSQLVEKSRTGGRGQTMPPPPHQVAPLAPRPVIAAPPSTHRSSNGPNTVLWVILIVGILILLGGCMALIQAVSCDPTIEFC